MDWWQDFFDQDYLTLFGPFLTPERTQAQVVGIQRMLDLPPGAEILDLACGQGRITVPLAQAEYRMTGLDYSPHLLKVARQTADATGVKVEWHEGDMREIPWTERFDAVINTFTAFGYFDEAGNRKVLAGVSQALRPGGRFLIDVGNRDRGAKANRREWFQVGERRVLSEWQGDPVTGRAGETWTWQEGDVWRQRTFQVRLYNASELTAMLREAGLRPLAYYGNWDLSALEWDSPRLIVVSKKEREFTA